MRETKFIEQNKAKWEEYEQVLNGEHMDADKLHELFINITDDLAYARTYYTNRSVRAYLNGLATRIFQRITTRESFPKNRIKRFWSTELPQIVWDSRFALFASFVLFITAFAIGMVSCSIDPEFPRIILGDSYVDMTLENIKNGDAMAVYKYDDMEGMTGRIALNNLWVDFITLISGILASIGTVFVLLYNGVMVGAFQSLFIMQGVFWESFFTIWVHGTLEIATIIISGGAGMVAGSGWIFPGTLSRLESFRLSLKRGFKLFLAVIPLTILAAFFEGYLTRATETPDAIRGLFIFISLVFVLWYFVLMPYKIAKRSHAAEHTEDHQLPDSYTLSLSTTEMKQPGRIFNESIAIFFKHFKMLGGISAVLAVGFLCILQYNVGLTPRIFGSHLLPITSGMRKFFCFSNFQSFTYLQVPIIATLCILSYRAIRKEMPYTSSRGAHVFSEIVSVFVLLLGIWLGLQCFGDASFVMVVIATTCIIPFFAMMGYIAYAKESNMIMVFSTAFKLFPARSLFIPSAYFTLFGFIVYMFLDSGIYSMLNSLFSEMSYDGHDDTLSLLHVSLTAFLGIWATYIVFILISIASALTYYSALERVFAISLFDDIKMVGTQKQIRGLTKE